MRARSVHLVTSWWVVGVWAALGISTGVISVVTVLQPSWYVRYTFIHAQEARDVSFQVLVSSVGPLGYCRLSSVDTQDVTETHDSSPERKSSPGIRNFTLPPVFTTTLTTTDPPEYPTTSSSVASLPPSTTTTTTSSSTTSIITTTTSANTSTPAEETLPEPTPPRVHYSTLSFGSSFFDLPPFWSEPNRGGVKEHEEGEEEEGQEEEEEEEEEQDEEMGRVNGVDDVIFLGENEETRKERVNVRIDKNEISTATEASTSPEDETEGNHHLNVGMEEEEDVTEEPGGRDEDVTDESEEEDVPDEGDSLLPKFDPKGEVDKAITYDDPEELDDFLQVTRNYAEGARGDTRRNKFLEDKTEEPTTENIPEQESPLPEEQNTRLHRLGGESGQGVDNGDEFIGGNISRGEKEIKGRGRNANVTDEASGKRRRRRKHKKKRKMNRGRNAKPRRGKNNILPDMDHYTKTTGSETASRAELHSLRFTRNKAAGSSQSKKTILSKALATELAREKQRNVGNYSPRKTAVLHNSDLPTPVITELSQASRRRVHGKGRDRQESPKTNSRSSRNRSRKTEPQTNEKKLRSLSKRSGGPERLRNAQVKLEDQKRIIAEFLRQQEEQLTMPLYSESVAIEYRPRTPILFCSGAGVGVGSGSSSVWVLVGVLYGTAGVLQIIAGVASLATQILRSPARRFAYAIWVSNVQVAVVMIQGVTLVLFPLGLGSPLARVECGGSSSVYWPGECSFGWSYMLAIVTTTLSAYCPCLARLTVFKKYALREWESLNFF